MLRRNGPRLLPDGIKQLTTGTALVRFATEAEAVRAFGLFSSPDAPRADMRTRLHAELRLDEVEQLAQRGTAPARPKGAPRLHTARRREHQRNRRSRELEQLDRLLELVEADAARQNGLAAASMVPGRAITWAALHPSLDPCRSARRMQPGTLRGERKRLTVEVFAQLLGEALPAALALPASVHPAGAGAADVSSPPRELTVVDCGCGTGNLLLPLATLGAAGVRFVGVDLKRRSLQLLAQRVRLASEQQQQQVRVEAWEGAIEAYDGPCDAVISLHACGGASDAALALAERRAVPFVVSPCCVGKIRRGPRSLWLKRALRDALAQLGTEDTDSSGDAQFASIAACADAASPGADAQTLLRRARAKLVVEQDRLAAAREGGGIGCRLVDMGKGGAAEDADGTAMPAVSEQSTSAEDGWAEALARSPSGSALSSSHLRHVLVGRFK